MKQKKEKKLNLSALKKGVFLIVTLGIVFDTKKRMILIGRRMNDPYIKKLTWSFPGGIPEYTTDLEKSLEKVIHTKTGLKVKNLGCVFTRIVKENNKIILMYHLCEVIEGKEKAKNDFVELKWVKPKELQNYFTTSFDPRLKEYLLNLK